MQTLTITTALRIASLVSSTVLLLILWRLPRASNTAKRRTPVTTIRAGLVTLFLIAFAYQATWQLAGFLRPDFVGFMRRYNSRPNNPVGERSRGLIIDRNRLLLAGPDASGNKRTYPLRETCAHLVGYTHRVYGNTGVERAASGLLTGSELPEGTDLGEIGKRLVDHAAVRGQDVQLTIDARLQDNAYRLLAGRPGAVVCLRPSDGAILAMVSSPAFDPNALSDKALKSDGSPMFNRALQGLYPPGSTFKIVVASAALKKGVATPLDCPGEGFSAGRGYSPIRDHEYYANAQRKRQWRGHGRIGIREAFAKSSNVYFAKLGLLVGGADLQECAKLFGLGQSYPVFQSGTGTLNAEPSRIPDLRTSPGGPIAQVSIGQGELLVTPLQMAMIAAAIADDGELWMPYANAATTPRLLGHATTRSVAREVRSLMRGVVDSGTARAAQIRGLTVAGKTGTAQAPGGADHSWFACFAPAEKPAVAMVVIVEHGGYGSAAALPIAVSLLKQCRDLGLLENGGRQE